jgi:hypothetical protein
LIHEKGFSTKQQLSYTETENGTICPIPYFWGNATLEVMGKIGDKEYRLAFDSDKILVVAVKNEVGEWENIETYDYVAEDEGLINKLETEIFKE